MQWDRNWATYAYAEILGTTMLMYVGCNSNVFSFIRYDMEIAFSFGMVVTAAMQSFGALSGAHINPSVTIANAILGYMKWDLACFYIMCQFIGGLIGVGLFNLTMTSTLTEQVCLTARDINITIVQAFFYEFCITGTIVLFFCSLWDERNNDQSKDVVSLVFGLTYMEMTLCSGNQTGASMNFVRTLAPAIYEYNFTEIWIYLLAQLSASIVVPLIWKHLFCVKPSSDTTTEPVSV